MLWPVTKWLISQDECQKPWNRRFYVNFQVQRNKMVTHKLYVGYIVPSIGWLLILPRVVFNPIETMRWSRLCAEGSWNARSFSLKTEEKLCHKNAVFLRGKRPGNRRQVQSCMPGRWDHSQFVYVWFIALLCWRVFPFACHPSPFTTPQI